VLHGGGVYARARVLHGELHALRAARHGDGKRAAECCGRHN
jgi:hypothetical protein